MINPIEHSKTKFAANKFKVEPYILPADIYGANNLIGRGGWTWYTGAASWFYKAGIEYILGMKIEKNIMSFNPCIPKEWKEYSIQYKYGKSIYNINVSNTNENRSQIEVTINGEKCKNAIYLNGDGNIYNVNVKI